MEQEIHLKVMLVAGGSSVSREAWDTSGNSCYREGLEHFGDFR